MAKYYLRLSIASGYKHGQGWEYANPPAEQTEYTDPVLCNNSFTDKARDLVMYASTHMAAAKLEVVRIDGSQEEVIRMEQYDGENVYFWFAAYQQKGQSIFEDRWYISRVYVPIGYYALMHPGNQYPDITTVACSRSLYDLKEQLGEEYGIYEIKS